MPTSAELDELFREHEAILQQTVRHVRFRHTMPQEGQDAIDAGLVTESNPNRMHSVNPGAPNSLRLRLTALGEAVTQAHGWVCTCAGHQADASARGYHPTPAINGMCSNCQSSLRDSEPREIDGRPSCGMCARIVDRDRPEQQSQQD